MIDTFLIMKITAVISVLTLAITSIFNNKNFNIACAIAIVPTMTLCVYAEYGLKYSIVTLITLLTAPMISGYLAHRNITKIKNKYAKIRKRNGEEVEVTKERFKPLECYKIYFTKSDENK